MANLGMDFCGSLRDMKKGCQSDQRIVVQISNVPKPGLENVECPEVAWMFPFTGDGVAFEWSEDDQVWRTPSNFGDPAYALWCDGTNENDGHPKFRQINGDGSLRDIDLGPTPDAYEGTNNATQVYYYFEGDPQTATCATVFKITCYGAF